METVRVPVTVGIARSRTLAKLISDTAKPFGALAILDRAAEEALLVARPVTDITGIAGRREKRLQPWGINNCLDFAKADRRLIRELLTVTGEALWWELNGEAVLPLKPDRPMHKALSRGGSFGEPTADPNVLFAWLIRNLERLVEELHYHEVCVGLLTTWVGYRDGRAGQGRASLEAPSDRLDILLEAARPCLRKAWIPRASAERMHLFAEKLSRRGQRQLGLFDPPQSRGEAIDRLKREVNGRHGRFVLRSAATLPLEEVYRDPSNGFDICDVRGKMCF
jgi:DNA polymerase V